MLLLKSISWINKDKEIRKLLFKYEIKKVIFKSFIFNEAYPIYKKLFFDFYFKKLPLNISISRCRTNCMFLGNSRSIINQFKLSRHSCKKYANYGFINGLKKSSF
jgi:ribosomal protein S14